MGKRDTRELILRTSLALFNALGEPNVTTNHIADEADISPGNLYYHFRSKDDIVLALFQRFLGDFIPLLDIPEDIPPAGDEFWFQLHLGFEVKAEYRFIYRNLADLSARIPSFDRAMRGLLQRERQSITLLLDGLERHGALNISTARKELLIESLLICLTYWIPFADLSSNQQHGQPDVAARALGRALMLLAAHLEGAERRAFSTLAAAYLAPD